MKKTLFAMAALAAQPALACSLWNGLPDEWGAFEGQVTGQFVNRDYVERPLFQLSSAFSYRAPGGALLTAPAAYIVDGASIPRVFWSFIGGPFSGHHLKASVVHDYYTDTCQIVPHSEPGRPCQSRLEAYLDDSEVHLNYLRGMLAEGVPVAKACGEYFAVRAYKTWDLDASGKPFDIRVLGRRIDRADRSYLEGVAPIMRASIAASIKTLKATDGAMLNMFPSGPVPATEAGVQDYVTRLTTALETGSYRQDLGSLGLLTNEPFDSLEALEPWPDLFLAERYDGQAQQFTNLAQFAPVQPGGSDALVDALGLTARETVAVEGAGEINWLEGPADTGRTKQQVIDLLTEGAPGLSEQEAQFGLRLYQAPGGPGYTYEIAPDLADRLERSGAALPYGRSGTIIVPEARAPGQDLFIQQAPALR